MVGSANFVDSILEDLSHGAMCFPIQVLLFCARRIELGLIVEFIVGLIILFTLFKILLSKLKLIELTSKVAVWFERIREPPDKLSHRLPRLSWLRLIVTCTLIGIGLAPVQSSETLL